MKKLLVLLLLLLFSFSIFPTSVLASDGVAPVEAEEQTAPHTIIPENAIVIDGDKIISPIQPDPTPVPPTGITLDWLPLVIAFVALLVVALIPVILKKVKEKKKKKK